MSYTIDVVGVALGAGRDQFRTENRPFVGPEGDPGAVPDAPGGQGGPPDARTSKIDNPCSELTHSW